MSAIVLFDGVCNFCNGSVNFIIRRDAKDFFSFAPLQSESGAELLLKHRISPDETDSIILIEDGVAYSYSTAALKIASRLDGQWPLFYGFIIIPAFIRDTIYKFVAKNRYKWFGQKDECMIPTPDIKARFLGNEDGEMGGRWDKETRR